MATTTFQSSTGVAERNTPAPVVDKQVFIVRAADAGDELLIDRVGIDNEGFVGYRPAALIGRPILDLVDAATAPDILALFGEAFRTRRTISTTIAVRSNNGQVVRCQATVVPLVPGPAKACALVVEQADMIPAWSRAERIVRRRGNGISEAGLPADLATAHTEEDVPGVTQLTKRELEIVHRIVSGDRVHAIADRLFLSQSTVRNHLSSIYRKLGMVSQQQLVDRFRSTSEG